MCTKLVILADLLMNWAFKLIYSPKADQKSFKVNGAYFVFLFPGANFKNDSSQWR
jgi:hypothetical protein